MTEIGLQKRREHSQLEFAAEILKKAYGRNVGNSKSHCGGVRVPEDQGLLENQDIRRTWEERLAGHQIGENVEQTLLDSEDQRENLAIVIVAHRTSDLCD